jgi:hypothetical protein
LSACLTWASGPVMPVFFVPVPGPTARPGSVRCHVWLFGGFLALCQAGFRGSGDEGRSCRPVDPLCRRPWEGEAFWPRTAPRCGRGRGNEDPRSPNHGPVCLVVERSRARPGEAERCRCRRPTAGLEDSYLVDPASSHMLVSKIKPCMSKYKRIYTAKLRMAH